MADNNNINYAGGESDGASGEVTFESWLEDLWRPLEGDPAPRMEMVDEEGASTAVEATNNNTSNSASTPLQSEASTASIPTPSSSFGIRYTPYPPSPYHPRIECKCPNGPGAKPARHWKTKCPFNKHRRSDVASCEECGRPFSRVDNLKRHLRDVHGVR